MTGSEASVRERILRAAFEEFAAKGFRGATIKSIAARAGLNASALIYHYFPNKNALFNEIVESEALQAPFMHVIAHSDAAMERPPEVVLTELGRGLLEFRAARHTLIRLVAGEVLRHRDTAETWVRVGPGRVLAFLEAYLARQVTLGRLRPHDSRSCARQFVGMLLPQMLGPVFLPDLMERAPSDEQHLAASVDTFLTGLRAAEVEEP